MRYLLTFIILISFSLSLKAQNGFSGTSSGSFMVYSIQSIDITNLTGAVSFNTPNDYFNGVNVDHYANIKVKSNENWQLSVSTQSTYFTAMSSNSSTDMPGNILSMKVTGRKHFKTLSTKGFTLQKGNRGSSGNRNDFDIDMNFDPGFAFNGGVYNIGILYTLTKQ